MAGVASAYGARQKIRELQLVHSRQRRDTYLANARAQVARIYVPLQAAITRVVLEYDELRSTQHSGKPTTETRIAWFKSELADFDDYVSNLLRSGADAFLTTELSEKLRSFARFLRASESATEATEKFMLGYDVYVPFLRGSRRFHLRDFRGGQGRRVLPFDVSLGLPGIGIVVRRQEIVSAPVTSDLFEERFVSDTVELRALIKEVTLGSRYLPEEP